MPFTDSDKKLVVSERSLCEVLSLCGCPFRAVFHEEFFLKFRTRASAFYASLRIRRFFVYTDKRE